MVNYYSVMKIGDHKKNQRTTEKQFDSLTESRQYYDSLCKKYKGSQIIELKSVKKNKDGWKVKFIYSNTRLGMMTGQKYRDISKR